MKSTHQKPYWKDVLHNLRAELNEPQPRLVVVNVNQPNRSWLWLLLAVPIAILLLIINRRMGTPVS